MGRNFVFYNEGIYHVYNRGVDKRTIFQDKKEWDRFLLYLELCQYDISVNQLSNINLENLRGLASESTRLVEVECFCLLKNHYHLVVKQLMDNGVSEFMQKLGTAYTMYFNAKHNRSGSLFQGTFKAKPIEQDGYYELVRAYVTLNYLVHNAQSGEYLDCLSDVYDKKGNNICSKVMLERYSNKRQLIKRYKETLQETITRREKEKGLKGQLIE